MNTDRRTRDLLAAARRDTAPTGDRARLRAALLLRLPIDPIGPGDSSAPPGGSVAPSTAGTAMTDGAHAIRVGLGKLLFGGLLIGTSAFIAGYFTGGAGAAKPVAVAMRPPFSTLAPDPDATRATRAGALAWEPVMARVDLVPPGPEASSRRDPRPAPIASVTPRASAASTSSLAEEAALLREAQASLRDGDAQRSLAHLDELASRHPTGLLREERSAARVLALCAAGRAADARVEAERFLAETPGFIHAGRVRASCAFDPASKH